MRCNVNGMVMLNAQSTPLHTTLPAIADAEALTIRMHAYAFNVYASTLVLNRVI